MPLMNLYTFAFFRFFNFCFRLFTPFHKRLAFLPLLHSPNVGPDDSFLARNRRRLQLLLLDAQQSR